MTLVLYPAIDLKGGNCVRLFRGDMDQATIFGENPGKQAATWQKAGFSWLHVVDLDGAFAGQTVNEEAVKNILASVSIPVQLGGGLRNMAGIEAWLNAGITRVILGSAAAKNPLLVKEAARAFPGRVAVGIDAKAGMVATEGWAETSDVSASELARRFEDAGVAAIIYTDISRDGTKAGLNLDETTALARSVRVPIIASGGVASLADIIALKAAAASQPNLSGSILGRALYDGSLNPQEALAAC
jgi:phosphoribosylformimino-5-aminoimidazole carboxamide ribotide isomerase